MAFLSDVHGNLPALEAVLTDLARRAIVEIFVAGDHLLGGDAPLDVWKRLTQVNATLVRGVSDLALASVDPKALAPTTDEEREKLAKFVATREAVGELVLARLRRLPERVRIPLLDGNEVVVVHGSPSDPSTEMSHDMTDEELSALVGDDPADIVVCGASHVAFQRELGGIRVLGLGSVGASPDGRFAHFAVLTPRVDGTMIEQAYATY